jgi:ATP-dependent protease ClpP protease subunit
MRRRVHPVASVARPREWQARYDRNAAIWRAEEESEARAEGRPARSWFAVARPENAAEPARIDIAAEIGYWGVTAQEFIAELRDLGSRPIDLHVNSPGGEVFDGLAILNAIIDHPARVVAYIDGLAASAASFLVQGADEIVMKRGAMMMIHDAIGGCYDNAAGMRLTAEILDAVSDSIADVYAAKAGQDAKHWRNIMSAKDTWYTAVEAVEAGLADRIEARGVADGEQVDDATPNDVANLVRVGDGSSELFVPMVLEAFRSGALRLNAQQPAPVAPPAKSGWLAWPTDPVEAVESGAFAAAPCDPLKFLDWSTNHHAQ